MVRSEVKQRLAEILTNASAVPVFRSYPASPPDELIWIQSTTGTLEYNVMGTTLPRDDKFTVTLLVMSYKPGLTPDEAEGRAEEIASTIVVAMAENVMVDDDHTEEFSIFDALVTTVDGPDAMPGPNGEGWDAFVRLNIDIHLRITREQ